jgi:acetoin:2,6-dichlorophenolindophenol oxidoreductase subunit beta
MAESLRSTIKAICDSHLSKGHQIFGQCLTAVGFVGGTLPDRTEEDGMIELPMADVAGGGFVVGSALMGRRPIYVIRYQGFCWYNLVTILNYACKSKEMWGRPCPILVRAIAMEGGIGPVAGSSHHSLCYRMPGIEIWSPMTSSEYKEAYAAFEEGDDVFYLSEHRGSYDQIEDLIDIDYDDPDFVLFPISITRFAAVEASKILEREGIRVSVFHQVRLKPYCISVEYIDALDACGKGCVLDDDYTDGIGSTISAKLMLKTGASVWTMGLQDKTAGFANHLDNMPPTATEIVEFIKEKL